MSKFWSIGRLRLLFFATLVFYVLCYAPYGINESDGGFLTGFAWQVLCGKLLYHDILYVRPPLPVWLRCLELSLLPDAYAILGERWLFYLKLSLTAWIAASILAEGERRWCLACFGFVLSVHCYPPASLHTFDGAFFAVLSLKLMQGPAQPEQGRSWGHWTYIAAGMALGCTLLCKQSFYPLLPLWLFGFWQKKWRGVMHFGAGFLAVIALFINYLYQNGILESYVRITNGATTAHDAFQRGVLDYFDISPLLLIPVLGLAAAWWAFTQKTSPAKGRQISALAYMAFITMLMLSYVIQIYQHQDFTLPFAHTRLLFGLAAWMAFKAYRRGNLNPMLLLGITWCISISWGYNLPISFSLPLIWGLMALWDEFLGDFSAPKGLALAYLAFVATFFYAYQFVYRDGQRRDMSAHLGDIFPSLQGIYSTPQKAAMYQELRELSQKYGPNIKTLPTFTQANFLTKTAPPLPLDWIVLRESARDTALILKQLRENAPVIFLEKTQLDNVFSDDPEYAPSRAVLRRYKIEEERNFFIVYLPAMGQ